jgi:formyltetrahydrofolate-dependent phosphoribosylglycinamide formyltransferase
MKRCQLAVFASGRGSNFENIINKQKDGFIPVNIVLLITNTPEAGAINIARANGIAVRVISPKDYTDSDSFNDAILNELTQFNIDIIALAGYLKLIGEQIINRYKNKILNIHPALLPLFGGKGMYGHHVHQAVFDSSAKVSGATVHLVNKEYDRGPIVIQKCVSIDDVQSPDEIAERVLTIEHEIYPQAIKYLAEERLIIKNNRLFIKPG